MRRPAGTSSPWRRPPLRINEPETELPPLPDQIDRFLVKLVGVTG